MSMVLDIAHVAFLEMIRTLVNTKGAAATKGELIRMALAIAKDVQPIDYPTMEDYKKAVKDRTNPLSKLEGESIIDEKGLAVLPACPFAPSIKTYTSVVGGLPSVYAEIVGEFNKEGADSAVTTKLRVGEGAGVSPFCCIHQPLRSAVADKITIGGKKIRVDMLACKSGSGKKGFADRWIKGEVATKAGITKEMLDKALDTNMCSYCIVVEDK